MDGNCTRRNIVYQAYIFPTKIIFMKTAHIRVSSLKFKFPYYNHKQYFNNSLLWNQTALSKCYWKLKQQWLTPMINWKIKKNLVQQVVLMVDAIYKLATVVESYPKASFSIANTPRLLHSTLETYLIMLSVKQGGINTIFGLSTCDWTPVFRTIGELSATT